MVWHHTAGTEGWGWALPVCLQMHLSLPKKESSERVQSHTVGEGQNGAVKADTSAPEPAVALNLCAHVHLYACAFVCLCSLATQHIIATENESHSV